MSGKKFGSPHASSTGSEEVLNPFYKPRRSSGSSNATAMKTLNTLTPEASEESILEAVRNGPMFETDKEETTETSFLDRIGDAAQNVPKAISWSQRQKESMDNTFESSIIGGNTTTSASDITEHTNELVSGGTDIACTALDMNQNAETLVQAANSKNKGHVPKMKVLSDLKGLASPLEAVNKVAGGVGGAMGALSGGFGALGNVKEVVGEAVNLGNANSQLGRKLAKQQAIQSTVNGVQSLTGAGEGMAGAVTALGEQVASAFNPVTAGINAGCEAYHAFNAARTIPGEALNRLPERNLKESAKAMPVLNSSMGTTHYRELLERARAGDEEAANTLDRPEYRQFAQDQRLVDIKNRSLLVNGSRPRAQREADHDSLYP